MTQRDWARFILRLPRDLDAFIESEARRNHRSKNSEFLYRLEQSRAGNASGGEGLATASPAADDPRGAVGTVPHHQP